LIRAILTDIEGTTSSIAFVKEELFPYARDHLAEYIEANHDNPELQRHLMAAGREAGKSLESVGLVEQLLKWIDQDRKITPLKAIQGMIWRDGYLRGDFKGHVYQDAADKLKEWHDRQIRLYVYSSGSVEAQKLIFGYSCCGDLTSLFSGYYDTRMGGKKETASYQAILGDIGLPAETVLFLSDADEELDAAMAAGMRTCQLLRAGDGAVPSGRHPQAADFTEIRLDI